MDTILRGSGWEAPSVMYWSEKSPTTWSKTSETPRGILRDDVITVHLKAIDRRQFDAPCANRKGRVLSNACLTFYTVPTFPNFVISKDGTNLKFCLWPKCVFSGGCMDYYSVIFHGSGSAALDFSILELYRTRESNMSQPWMSLIVPVLIPCNYVLGDRWGVSLIAETNLSFCFVSTSAAPTGDISDHTSYLIQLLQGRTWLPYCVTVTSILSWTSFSDKKELYVFIQQNKYRFLLCLLKDWAWDSFRNVVQLLTQAVGADETCHSLRIMW
jgi:hypothetical protein